MMPHGITALRNMRFVLNYLSEHPCVDCGETDPRVLDFDHKDEKNFCIGDSLTRSSLTVDVLEKEIHLCDVRCANCHRKRHCLKSYRTKTVAELDDEIFRRTFTAQSGVGRPLQNITPPRKWRSSTNLKFRTVSFSGVPKEVSPVGRTDEPQSIEGGSSVSEQEPENVTGMFHD